jgi:hypothetical protein
MDEQKWSSCSWLLLHEFVKVYKEKEEERDAKIAAGELTPENAELELPAIPYVRIGQALCFHIGIDLVLFLQWKCRVIMTRPDFLEELDRLNIINIDVSRIYFIKEEPSPTLFSP